MISHYEPLFCTPDTDIVIQIRNGQPVVISGTVNKILEKIKDNLFVTMTETEFESIVLFTHEYFIPSDALLQNLVYRFESKLLRLFRN